MAKYQIQPYLSKPVKQMVRDATLGVKSYIKAMSNYRRRRSFIKGEILAVYHQKVKGDGSVMKPRINQSYA